MRMLVRRYGGGGGGRRGLVGCTGDLTGKSAEGTPTSKGGGPQDMKANISFKGRKLSGRPGCKPREGEEDIHKKGKRHILDRSEGVWGQGDRAESAQKRVLGLEK